MVWEVVCEVWRIVCEVCWMLCRVVCAVMGFEVWGGRCCVECCVL